MWGFLIVAAVFGFVFGIVKMSLKHAENIERIKYGYPTIDAEKRSDVYPSEAEIRAENRN